ncbi:MAG: hypothetical protein U7123_27920 [Potamolinea sp.]
MKLTQKAIAAVFLLGTMGNTFPAVAEPISTSMTQRDGSVDLKTCMTQATGALEKMKFNNIKVSETSAVGDYQDYLALITCYEVKSAKGVLVQSVVVSGPSNPEARKLREGLTGAMN